MTTGNQTAGMTPSRSWLSRVRSFTLKTVLVLVLLFMLVVALVCWLTGTDSGFARLSKLANDHVPGLSIDSATGNLVRGVNARSIDYVNDNLHITASGLNTRWTANCLLANKFCLDELQIDTLEIETYATATDPSASTRTSAIELPEISLPVAVDVTQATIGSLRFKGAGEVPVQILDDIRLSASIDNSLVEIDTLSVVYHGLNEQTINARLQGKVELSGPYPLDMLLQVNSDDVLPDTLPEGSGEQALFIESQLSNSVTDLDISSQLSGVVQLAVQANVQPLEPSLPATLKITADELGWPVQSRAQVLAKEISIEASGDMNDYSFSIATGLSGEQLPDTQLALAGTANLERLKLQDITIDTLNGTAAGEAQLSLIEPMQWTTRWSIDNIDPSLQVPDLDGQLGGKIRASGSIQQNQWSLKLDQAKVDGVLRGLPFHFDGKLSKGLNNLWFVEHVTLNNDRNQVRIQGVAGDKLDLKADIDLPQLQNFLPGLAGGFDARLTMNGAMNNPDINLDANAEVIYFNDILVQSLSINGDINNLFLDTSKLDISVDSLRIGENTISETSLALTGKRSDHQLTLKARGPQDIDIALALNGNLNDALDWSGQLNKAQASLPPHQLTLSEPAAIGWQNNDKSVSVSAHCWLLDDEYPLCLQDDFSSASQGSTTVSLGQCPLSLINPYLPDTVRLDGMFAADIELRRGNGGVDDIRAIVEATIDKASVQIVDPLGEAVSFDYDAVALNADLTSTDANATLSLKSSTSTSLKQGSSPMGDAEIQLRLNPSDPQDAISGSVTLQDLSLAVAEPFFPDVDVMDGMLSASGTLAGTIAAPLYNGTVTLDSPLVQTELLPLPITGGRITATVAGQRMTMGGNLLSNEGSVNVSGRGVLDPQKWNVDVSLTGKQLIIQREPLDTATLNGDIRIVVNNRRMSVTGSIDMPEAVINVAELPEGAVTISNDVVFIDEVEEETPVSVAARSNPNLSVLIDVTLGDKVSLSAYGLDAKLNGDMEVRIRGDRPLQLGGEIRVVDGIYKQYGQNLTANGEILFVGDVESTRLNIDAVRDISNEDRTAGLRIQGTASKPDITLFTEPSDKSEDAILSYVVLGRDINEASDQDADLLSTAALALAVRGGRTVGSGVASRLGVRDFGLETRGNGDDTELLVSGRLNDRLLLRYGHGVFDAANTLYVRYDLTKKLYLEAAQSVQEAVLDLFYSFSF